MPSATDPNSVSVVRIQQLSKTFVSRSLHAVSGWHRKLLRLFTGKPMTVHAVKNVTFDVRRGEVFGLLGPNGSGKSTTIKMLLGLLAPTSGTIEVLGQPPHDVAVKHRIGFLPEETYLYRFLTAEETLDFYGKLFNLSASVRRDRIAEYLTLVGLDPKARRRPLKEYSKGMARRVGLAQALINNPDLVVLDEPTSGFDPIGNEEIKQIILKLKSDGKTIILCSHLLADVEEVCDRVAIMCDGDLLANGTLKDLLSRRDALEVEINRADEGFQERLRDFVAREGAAINRSAQASDTLARLFLRLVDQNSPHRIPANLRSKLLNMK